MPVDDLLPWEDTDTDTGKAEEKKELEVQLPPETTATIPDDQTAILWRAMQDLHGQDLSLMWGRAEPESIKGKRYEAKTPLSRTWSSEVEAKLTLDALAKIMNNATPGLKIAPIIICGKGSGNLWAIDIDIKHWPGIDTKYFAAIRETYPELWKKLRIHRTPSGGYHIVYRTEEFVLGSNIKLAFKEGEKESGIETRAHGGYIMAPPGMGYSVFQDVPIPTLSVDDHNRLIDLAKLFNEKTKPKAIRPTKKFEEIYDENPFQHYNGSPAAAEILLNFGWEVYKETSEWIHFTRPGKDKGISASYNKEKGFYHIFTSSTEFEGDKTYDAAAVRCKLEFDDDYKKMYPVLVKEEYGRYKPQYEARVIKMAANKGKPLPPNFSEAAKTQLQHAIQEKNTKYPHGIFWEYNPSSENYIIQRELLDRFLNSLGVRGYHGEPCVIEGQFVRKLKETKNKIGESGVYELIKSWIREEDDDTLLRISHEFSKFWQTSGEFTVSKLQELDKTKLLKSNPKKSYKFFKDVILEIDGEGLRPTGYGVKGEYLIWSDEVIQRDWRYIDREAQGKTIFPNFIRKAISSDPLYVDKVLGYLCCGYKVSGEGYLIAFMEPSDTSKGGGTGKNFTFDMLGYWISILTTNGQAVKRDIDQLIQNWFYEKLVHLADLPKWVNLSDLKSIVTDNAQRKLLYKNIQNIDKEDMPKFVLSGQFGINVDDDGGVKGRVRQVSFSGYFTRGGRDIRSEYGGDVPDIFTEADWDGYYSYLADCVVEYMKVKKLERVEDDGLWLKGWDLRFSGGDGYLRDAIDEQIGLWAKNVYTTNGQVSEWYDGVCRANGVGLREKIRGGTRLNIAIKEYGDKTGMFSYDTGSREYVDGIRQRVVKIKMLGEEEKEEILPF